MIAVKDCFTKEIIACEISRRHTALEVEKVMYLAFANRNLREFLIEELYVTSDNGKEIVKAMKSLRDMGIVNYRITPRSPWENGEIESFFLALRGKCFNGLRLRILRR